MNESASCLQGEGYFIGMSIIHLHNYHNHQIIVCEPVEFVSEFDCLASPDWLSLSRRAIWSDPSSIFQNCIQDKRLENQLDLWRLDELSWVHLAPCSSKCNSIYFQVQLGRF